MEEPHVYQAPNIRDQALSVLISRCETRRSRRLMAAIELNQLRQIKAEKLADKEQEKFTKLLKTAANRLEKALELLDKADNEIKQAQQLSNHVAMLRQEIG